MSITVINYLDQTLADNVTAAAAQRAAAEEAARAAKAAEEAARAAGNDFSTILNNSTETYAADNGTPSQTTCSAELDAIFEEASQLYGVSKKLLKSIAKAESNFNPNAVSSAGAVGIMQLMPHTAASLGVSNSYDARENILGGARLMAQLLSKYNGNTALALAAYNAGSGNVAKYGGIPPFNETQTYVKKVISNMDEPVAYMNAPMPAPTPDSIASSPELTREKLEQSLDEYFSSQGISRNTLDLLATLIAQLKNTEN